MLRTIHLHGSLAEEFGESFTLDVASPAEGVRALCVQLPGFERTIRAGEWACLRGEWANGIECDEELIKLHFGGVRDFHIMPAAYGRKKKGIGKTILGIVLIVTGFVLGNPYIISAGISLTLSGVAMMLSPTPKVKGDVDQKEGFLFSGAANTSSQGGAMPLVFGRIRAGSVVVSAGISSDRMEHADQSSPSSAYISTGTGLIGTVVSAILIKQSSEYY